MTAVVLVLALALAILIFLTIRPVLEPFASFSQPLVVLMGDSIFQNSAYVPAGQTVGDLLKAKVGSDRVVVLAEDHATISDMFAQLSRLSLDWNRPSVCIFLSGGGNDLLVHYVDRQQDPTSLAMLEGARERFAELVRSIRARLPKASLSVVDVYYPTSNRFQIYRPAIREWNRRLQDVGVPVISISKHLTDPKDFAFEIEPSSQGGEKIVSLLT